MENTNAIDEIKRMAEILSASRTERKAFILMPTFKGFDVYEVSEPLAQHCISAEALRKSAEADSTGKGQSNIPDVSNNEVAVCDQCGANMYLAEQKYWKCPDCCATRAN